MRGRIAVFVNRYPAVSHTFIRREIRALESLGLKVFRIAIRPGGNLTDPDDKAEQARTRYVLERGAWALIAGLLKAFIAQPTLVLAICADAVRLGWRSDRGLLRHFAYMAEAAVLARWCVGDEIEHIHAHFGTNSAVIAMFASRLSRIPFSFTAHGSEEFEKAPLLSLDEKLRHAAFAVCVSLFGRSQLMRWSPADQWDKISVVHCGIDDNFMRTSPTPPPSIARLVCVARLSEEKAHLVLIGAARRLHAAGVEFELVFAGDGPMRPRIEEAIREAGLQHTVTITGWIPGEQVRAQIAAARALVLASFMENLPVVIMESLALGRPVISTYVGGIPELVQPGISGWLVPAGDEISLADAMSAALQTPVERLTAMGLAGRKHVVDNHDARKEAAKLKKLFQRTAR
jgi:glycosyltransferase involved in cell wall biosynthesis